jgi:citrate lyase beta subunit
VPEEYRSRRSCLAVPGSSQRFLDKARGLAADEVFLDLEDAVAPAAKEAARRNVIAALNDGGWGGKLVAVRVNSAFAPSQEDYERAELIIDAYRYYTSVEHRGAVMLGGEMIDEASRKLALVAAANGRAAGLRRSRRFEPPMPEGSVPDGPVPDGPAPDGPVPDGSAEHAPPGEGPSQPAG